MKVDINKYKITSLFLDRKTPYYQTSIVPKLIYKFNLFLKQIPPVPYWIHACYYKKKISTAENTNKNMQENSEKEKKMRVNF